MKKRILINGVILSAFIVEFFLPFTSAYNNDVSFFDFALSFIQSHTMQKTWIIISSFYLFSILLLVVSTFFTKKGFIILTTISITTELCLFLAYTIMYVELSGYLIPSWSFYLSLLLLIGWIAYLFSPKWFPRLKKAFAVFRSKHPTKAERIAELEREVNQLKSQDESTDISSHSDSNEKTSD